MLTSCDRVMVKVMDYGLIVSEFEPHSNFYVQIPLGNIWTPHSLNNVLNSTTIIILDGGIWH